MVEIKYGGRLGNRAFQYAFSRLLSEELDQPLFTHWDDMGFWHENRQWVPKFPPEVLVHSMHIRDDYAKRPSISRIAAECKNRRVVCDGYFQDHHYYDDHREAIQNFWNLPKVEVNETDIVMHVRLGDYWDQKVDSVINPNWYDECLLRLKFNRDRQKLYVVCEDPKDPWFKLWNWRQYRPTFVSGSVGSDFNFIRQFKTVVSSNSSFCWWACFLGHSERVMGLKRWMRHSQYINLAETNGWEPIIGSFIPWDRLETLRSRG